MTDDPNSVAIVGAGIVGMSAALYLRRAGLPVAVIDPLPPGGGASYGNAGLISVESCVPIALPGMLHEVPRWLADPLAPLAVRPHQPPRDPRRLGGAKVRGFENGAHDPLRRDRILLNIFAGARQHAAEILRPRTIDSRVDDHMVGMPRLQYLHLRRETEKGVDLALREQVEWLKLRVGNPADVPLGVEANLGGHQRQQRRHGQFHTDALALQVGDAADAVVCEQLEAAAMQAGQQGIIRTPPPG